jgi:hypothetical protein
MRQAELTPEDTAGRERTADRLLRSTAARSYDPDLDIDWSAPLVAGQTFLLEHRCSLYGTPEWQRLSPEQRLELNKHELASVAGFGIWPRWPRSAATRRCSPG